MIDRLRFLRAAAWACVLLLVVVMGFVLLNPRDEGGEGVAHIGGPFRLAATDGRIIEMEALKGRPYALFFGFTRCPDICPTTMIEIASDLQALDPATREFNVYFVTVDPERDDAESLATYTASFDPRIIGLVPANEAELAAVAGAFRAYWRKVPTPSSYTMDHTAAIYLMNARGEFAGTISANEPPEIRRAKLSRLLRS